MLKKMHVVLLSLAMLFVVGGVALGQVSTPDSVSADVEFSVTVPTHLVVQSPAGNVVIAESDWKLENEDDLGAYLLATKSVGDAGSPHLQFRANRLGWTLSVLVDQGADAFFGSGGTLEIAYDQQAGNNLVLPSITFSEVDRSFTLVEAKGDQGTYMGIKKYAANLTLNAPLQSVKGGQTYQFTLVYTITSNDVR